jgi:SAM-dependent methyltransferase
MNQDAIWDHFQNEGVESFRHADPRLEYLARQLSAGERVLNIGVGSGALERMAIARGVEIWSLDPGERTIEKLRETLGVGDRAKSGYSQDMPFPDAHFDALIMSEVVEHLEPDVRDKTLVEVHRVLRPGGRFIGTVPARENLEDSMVVCPQCQHHFHRWGHRSSFDAAAMRRLLERHFEVETLHERFFNEWDSAGWSRRLQGLVKKFLSWRGIGTYGVARNLFFIARKRG